MSTTANRRKFALPSQVAPVAGTEAAASMYPYYTRFKPEDDNRFWFYNSMHFPEPMPAFDIITAEAAYAALGAFNSRVFCVPAVLGIEHRIVNGRVYIGANVVTDPAIIEQRLQLFQKRAFHYFGNWDKLYEEEWKKRMMALIREVDGLEVPELPEIDDEAVVMEARGVSQNQYLLENYHRCIETMFRMWQYHFEFLLLGYGAYLTFFQFCKKAFPEITDQTIARMTAGVDVLMFRPDNELKRLARLAVDLKIDDKIVEGGNPRDILAAIGQLGDPGKQWIAEFEKVRDPWFHMSTGDGFYHHHRSWNDLLEVPFAALPRYIKQIKAGTSLDRPTEELKRERGRIIDEYRQLLSTKEDRSVFDQMLGLTHLVFPYVEDHKFYCEHWYTTLFFNKIRAFGALLARHGFFAEADDVFQLHHSEITQALCDLSLSWAAGSPARGREHWPKIVAERKEYIEKWRDWRAPPALGPVPEDIQDPLLLMLWGITSESLAEWSAPVGGINENELRGFAASPGIAEGIACVVTNINEIARVREGEILVCPVTSPSWAPVFGKVKAAVSDIGGTMSHAAIVAREYGMPAVVGTGHATRMIRTGQRVRVDGNTGLVTLLG